VIDILLYSLFAVYIVFITTQRMFNHVASSSMLYNIILSGSLTLTLIITVLKYKIDWKYRELLSFIVFFLIGSMIEVIVKGSFAFATSFILLIGNIGITYYLFKEKMNLPIIKYLYYFVVSFFLISIFMDKNPKFLLENLSSNHISVIVLYVTVLYYIEMLRESKNWSIIPAIIFFIISVYAGGRSGIVSSAFMVSGLVFFNKNSNKYVKFIITLAFIVFLSILYNYSDFRYEIFEKFYTRSIQGEPRINIISSYFSNLSIKSIMFGYEPNYVYSFFHTGNLHNSFLVLHYRYGIIGIITMIFIVKKILKLFVNRKFYLLVVVMSILIRALTDTILIPFYFDFVLFYLLFYLDFKTNNLRNGDEVYEN